MWDWFTIFIQGGLVHDLYSRMEQMLPLFNDNQQLDESELMYFIVNKVPISHKAIWISQDFIPETVDIATYVEHYERAETTDNIGMDNFSASDEESDSKKNKKSSKKTKERDDISKKRRKNSSIYCILHREKMVPPQGSAKSSRQGLQKKTNKSTTKRITRRSSSNFISCRHNLPIKNPSMKS